MYPEQKMKDLLVHHIKNKATVSETEISKDLDSLMDGVLPLPMVLSILSKKYNAELHSIAHEIIFSVTSLEMKKGIWPYIQFKARYLGRITLGRNSYLYLQDEHSVFKVYIVNLEKELQRHCWYLFKKLFFVNKEYYLIKDTTIEEIAPLENISWTTGVESGVEYYSLERVHINSIQEREYATKNGARRRLNVLNCSWEGNPLKINDWERRIDCKPGDILEILFLRKDKERESMSITEKTISHILGFEKPLEAHKENYSHASSLEGFFTRVIKISEKGNVLVVFDNLEREIPVILPPKILTFLGDIESQEELIQKVKGELLFKRITLEGDLDKKKEDAWFYAKQINL